MNPVNNFILGYYVSEKYFCDRIQETDRIVNTVENGRNINIISHRRMGKTALIFHLKHILADRKNLSVIYIDLLNTQNIDDFIHEFALVVLNALETKSSKLIKQFAQIVKGIRPNLSFNPISGIPEIGIDVQSDYSKELSIAEIFQFLQNYPKRIVIAFDEFQQILEYPEKNIEASLRKYIQQSPNLSFIYSGSQTHLLTNMFSNHKRPFYQSAEFLFLDRIEQPVYADFIKNQFENGNQYIDIEDIELILQITRRHTYYVQFLCNRIFSLRLKKISKQDVINTLNAIISENRPVYYTYQKMITHGQLELLKAIAKEDGIEQPYSKTFIKRHKLPTPSSVRATLKALLSKELLFEHEGNYFVYDVFFANYLKALN